MGVPPEGLVVEGEDLEYSHSLKKVGNGAVNEGDANILKPATIFDPGSGFKKQTESQKPTLGLNPGSESKLQTESQKPTPGLNPGSGSNSSTNTQSQIINAHTEIASKSGDAGSQEVYLGDQAWKQNPFDITMVSTRRLLEKSRHHQGLTEKAIEKVAKDVLAFLVNLRPENIVNRFEEFLLYRQSNPSSKETSHEIINADIQRQVERFKSNDRNMAYCRMEAFMIHYEMAKYVNGMSKKDKGVVYDSYVQAEFASVADFLKVKQSIKAYEAMKSIWKRRKDIGEKLSRMVDVFGRGIVLAFPTRKLPQSPLLSNC